VYIHVLQFTLCGVYIHIYAIPLQVLPPWASSSDLQAAVNRCQNVVAHRVATHGQLARYTWWSTALCVCVVFVCCLLLSYIVYCCTTVLPQLYCRDAVYFLCSTAGLLCDRAPMHILVQF
jgi:hypothetical protein